MAYSVSIKRCSMHPSDTHVNIGIHVDLNYVTVEQASEIVKAFDTHYAELARMSGIKDDEDTDT